MTKSSRRRILLAPLALAAMLPFGGIAQAASDWPGNRPMRLIVPYSAGGVTDVAARLVAEKLGARLGTTIVVENRSGASGLIGMNAVAASEPDGYTVGISSISALSLTPHLNEMPFDAKTDIQPVVSIMYTPCLVLATPSFKANTFQEMLDYAKAKPGEVRWSSPGQGSLAHIMLEQISAQANVTFNHIPYRDFGQQISDTQGGRLELSTINPSKAIMEMVRTGKMRPIAIGANERMEELPEVPTLAELGFAEANRTSIFGMFAPAGVPQPIVDRLASEITQILAEPEMRTKLLNMGNYPTGGSSADFVKTINDESETNARIIKAANITLQ